MDYFSQNKILIVYKINPLCCFLLYQYDQELRASKWSSEYTVGEDHLQVGVACGYYQPQTSSPFREFQSDDSGVLRGFFTAQDASSALSGMGPLDNLLNNQQEAYTQNNHVNYGGDPVGGTGIKIRTRQPQHRPMPGNIVAQGIAPRRIRLQMCKVMDASSNGEQEAQSALTEVSCVE